MINYVDIPVVNGKKTLPKKYQNGSVIITGFTDGAELYIPIGGLDISPNENSIGVFFDVTNGGVDSLSPKLILKIAGFSGNQFRSIDGTLGNSLALTFGSTVKLSRSSAGDPDVLAAPINSDAPIPPAYELPVASDTVLGGIKVGNNLIVDEDGLLSALPFSLPIASDAILGGIKVGSGLGVDVNGVLSVIAGSQLNIATNATNPAANVNVQVVTLALPIGKWLISASQLTAATGTIPVGTGIKAKIATTTADISDDAYIMSASVIQLGGGGGRFGATVPTRMITMAAAGNVYLNYQTTNALTATIFGQLTAIKLA